MKHFLILTAAALLWAACGSSDEAQAGCRGMKSRVAYRHSQAYPWHGDYYDVAWGVPVALVVPPTAETRLTWVGAWAPPASRRSSTSSGAAILARASRAGRSIPPRLGLAAPINSAIIISAVRGSPPRLRTLSAPCLAGQSDRRAVLFLFLAADRGL